MIRLKAVFEHTNLYPTIYNTNTDGYRPNRQILSLQLKYVLFKYYRLVEFDNKDEKRESKWKQALYIRR